jgi:hypothetical protein
LRSRRTNLQELGGGFVIGHVGELAITFGQSVAEEPRRSIDHSIAGTVNEPNALQDESIL